MILKQIEVKSSLIDENTNCYIFQDENTREAICIDPGGDLEKIEEMLNIMNAKLKYIYLTHSHLDHIEKARELKEKAGGEILISRKGAENINNSDINLANLINTSINIEIDSRVDDKDILHVGDIELKVIYTPGHTDDSTCLYCESENLVFTGDTLMYMRCGRCDFPTGNKKDLRKSLKKLFLLPENTFVYPGHGLPTTIKDEKERKI